MATSFLDKTGLGLVWAQIKLLLADKVDKVDGKGLSSNDYTAEEKAKLANIATGAEVNVNADWDAVTGDAAILHKPSIPTATSDLTNDSGFITVNDVPDATTTTSGLMSAADKVKLNGIAAGADDNVIEAITVNNSATTVTNKTVNITVPTNNNQLTNGAGYQTESDVNALIAAAVGDITGVDFEVVSTLPETGETGVIYLIANGGSGENSYDEYIWLSSSSSFEKIGSTSVDLSDYYNTTNLIPITSAEINTICV